jgi:hypothetical protein
MQNLFKKYIYLFIFFMFIITIIFSYINTINNNENFKNNDDVEKINPVILLTCCVNIQPQVVMTNQTNNTERLQQYLKTINNWKNSELPVIIVENSGYEFKELKDKKSPYYAPNIEVISYNYSDYDLSIQNMLKNTSSKGLHEMYEINWAYNKSNTIKNYSHVIKVTGRYFIPNFQNILINIPNNIDGIRQNNVNRCEVVGSSLKEFDNIFNVNVKHQHVEKEWKLRMQKLEKEEKKVYTFPRMPIEKTQRGGGFDKKTFFEDL